MSDEVNDAVKTKLDVIPGIAMEYFSLTSNIVVLTSVDLLRLTLNLLRLTFTSSEYNLYTRRSK